MMNPPINVNVFHSHFRHDENLLLILNHLVPVP
jgi:hypothetical protein